MSDIPDKIYIEYNLVTTLESNKALYEMREGWNLTDCGESCIEYTLTPKAKRFSEEKPKDGEFIAIRLIKGDERWGFDNWNTKRNDDPINDEFEWFPVTLPIEE